MAYLLLVGVLAAQGQSRLGLLAKFHGLPRYLAALGLTLFLVNWANFLLYVALGWGAAYQLLSWGALLLPVLYVAFAPRPLAPAPVGPDALSRLRDFRRWDWWFVFLAVFVVSRFCAGLYEDRAGQIWSNFNFTDTPFHLSVVNAFLESPRFPPVDLDMAPYPLKYHFLADFFVAHLSRLGLTALRAMWLMNVVSATVLVGTFWATASHWLKLPARWIALSGLIFLFLHQGLPNLLHYHGFRPAFFNAADPFAGILMFPYFNFEYSLYNLIEPQRGLLFTLPVVLLILHAAFGETENLASEPERAAARTRTLQAFALICLLPLAHIVAFAVLALSLVPRLWLHRGWFLRQAWWWGPVFVLGVLQLLYLQAYGPPTNTDFSAWDVGSILPLQDFRAFPAWSRRAVFWFFVNGDFLFWGLLFGALAAARRLWSGATAGGLWNFLRQWRGYFAATAGCFVLINYYRYSFAWGDSNKFVLFLNLGLSLVIVLGAAQWLGTRHRLVSTAFWWFFCLLCVGPATYEFYTGVIAAPHGKILLFVPQERAAADWLKQVQPRSSLVLTAPYQTFHFVSPLAGLPTPAGIYADSNPYLQAERAEQIRLVYEGAEFPLLARLKVRYVCLSAAERRVYKLHPRWHELMASGKAVAFHAGVPEDSYSVFIFDAEQLMAP